MDNVELKKCVSHHVYESPRMDIFLVESETFLSSSVGTGGDAGGTGSDFPWASGGGDASGMGSDFSWASGEGDTGGLADDFP